MFQGWDILASFETGLINQIQKKVYLILFPVLFEFEASFGMESF